MKSIIEDKIFNRLIIISNLLFLLLFVLLSFYNRIATDDYYFLANVTKHGIIDGTIIEHQSWSGRWFSVILNQFILSFHHFKYSLFIYEIGAMVLFVFSIYRFIKNILPLFNFQKIDLWKMINYSIFFISAIFYSTIKIDETWFWLCASCTYLISVIMFFLGVSAILSNIYNITEFVFCLFPFAYIGGSCEPFALFIIFTLIIFWIMIYKDFIRLSLSKKQTLTKCIIAILSCSISFYILYIANGNIIRRQFFDDTSILETITLNIITTGMIILLRLPRILPFVILFSIPIILLLKPKEIVFNATIKKLVIILLSYFLAIYIYQFPVTHITQDIAAYRALFPITLITLLFSTTLMSLLFFLIPQSIIKHRSIALTSLVIICTYQTFIFSTQLTIIPEYTKAYDNRISYLKKHQYSNQVISLKPLPSSGLLYSAEISTDSLHFVNKHLQNGLNIKSRLILSY